MNKEMVTRRDHLSAERQAIRSRSTELTRQSPRVPATRPSRWYAAKSDWTVPTESFASSAKSPMVHMIPGWLSRTEQVGNPGRQTDAARENQARSRLAVAQGRSTRKPGACRRPPHSDPGTKSHVPGMPHKLGQTVRGPQRALRFSDWRSVGPNFQPHGS
jgi:hypothetical protein